MKRPLVVITAGFVLGEVLALCLQEAVYRIFFWFAGVLFLTVLAVRRFLSRSVMYRTLLLIFVFVFGGMTAGSFSGARCREQMEQEEKRIIQAGFGDVVQLTGQVVDVREKSEKLEIIVNQVKVGKRVRNIADPDDIRWLSLQYPVQLSGTPGDLEGWEEKLLPGKQVKMACSFRLTEPAKIRGNLMQSCITGQREWCVPVT